MTRCEWCGKIVWPWQKGVTSYSGVSGTTHHWDYHVKCRNKLHEQCVACGRPCTGQMEVSSAMGSCVVCSMSCGIAFARPNESIYCRGDDGTYTPRRIDKGGDTDAY